MTDLYDYHNGPNLGLEPTTPRQVRGEYLTLVFEKPISPAVHAIFAAQEWVAASHYDALRERDNYAREVAELRAENKRLREELSKMRAEPSDEEIDSIAVSMPDGAGGMLKQWGYRQFARALLARYGNAAAHVHADDARDAARYRLLRRKVCIECGEFHIRNLDPLYIGPDAAAKLDAAIDAAMSKGGK